jgi:hypothetical protein
MEKLSYFTTYDFLRDPSYKIILLILSRLPNKQRCNVGFPRVVALHCSIVVGTVVPRA